jgi:hypothetical protein
VRANRSYEPTLVGSTPLLSANSARIHELAGRYACADIRVVIREGPSPAPCASTAPVKGRGIMTSVSYAYDDLMNPVIRTLKLLGGSGTNEEINNKVAELLKIPAEQLEILHNPEKGGMTEIEYRLMWTRTYLKRYGVIANSARAFGHSQRRDPPSRASMRKMWSELSEPS